MLNRIINASLANRMSVLLLAVAIMMGGIMVMLRTEVDIFPDLNAPTVVVMTEAPGMAPEEVERVVTYPIEVTMNGATGVRRVRSTSNTGFSAVWVEFDWDTDAYRARQIVSERLAGMDGPVMGAQSSILGEVMIIGLTAGDTTTAMELRTLADRIIAPRLLSLGGVAQVAVIGDEARQWQIRLDPARMKALNVSLDEVMEAVESITDNASAGAIYDYGNEYLVKAELTTTDADLMGQSAIRSDERGTVRVADVATIAPGGEHPLTGVASVRGVPSVLVTVTKQPGVGTIELTERIDAELAALAPGFPHDVTVSTDIFRQSDFISNSISNLQRSLLEGALFVVIVLFFFLMNLRTTLISVVALPVSIIVAVLVLHFMGFTINTMSLGGIAIAIGSLVDDAIVDVENVYKRLRQNRALPPAERQPALRVIYHASAEVRMPIFNSSLIIIASFLPLFFLTGMEGRMLIPLGIAFIVALIASTVVALTLTPVLCSYLLTDKATERRELNREPWAARKLRAVYSRLLTWALGHQRGLLIGTGVLFVAAIAGFFTLGRSFLPGFNEGSFTINVSTLPGVSLEESDRIGRQAEELILSVPEIRTVARKTGRAELDEHSFGVNVSEIEAPYILSGRTRAEVAAELRHKLGELPGVNIEIGQPISHRIDAMLSGTQAQIAIKLFGDDLNQLFALGQRIKHEVSEVEGVVDVNIEQQTERPELIIKPKRDLMAHYGITMAQFRRWVEVALQGREVSQVFEEGFPVEMVVMFDPAVRSDLASLADLPIDSNAGTIPLSAVAEILSEAGPNTINRENARRRVVISANAEGRDLRGIVDDIRRNVAENVQLPEGYFVTYGGQFESEESASRTLMWTSLGALLIILMLLYGEFHSASQSIIILLNMPLALIGGIFILLCTGGELNIPAIIGFISLMGITTRNGMLLMSRYNALKAEGVSLAERVRRGSDERLLPIVMTALTSALALLPLAFNGDKPGNEIQSPMAIVILGGLISSTILNMLVVPVVYKLNEELGVRN